MRSISCSLSPCGLQFQGMFGNYRLPKDGSAAAGASDSNKAGMDRFFFDIVWMTKTHVFFQDL